jgi:crossover junction endodeoxyribonuclease RusA
MTLAVFIPGSPAPQGSKSFMGTFRGKSGRMHAKMVESSKKAPAWRTDVRAGLLDDDDQPKAYFDGPVHVELEFIMPRPASTPKRVTPPAVKKPDLDKLQRAVFDAIGSAGVWRDDSQVTSVQATKRLAGIGETPGLHLFITTAMEKKEAA